MSRLFRSNLARTAAPVNEEALQTVRSRFRASQFMRYALRPISLAILIVALLLGLLDLIETVTLDERWSSLTILFFLVTLEAIYTTNWLHHPDRLKLNSAAYRAAELLIITIIVRVISWRLFEGRLPNTVQLQEFLTDPTSLFLNVPFVITFVLTLIAWQLGIVVSKIFSDLEVSEFELRYYSMPLAQRKALSDDQPIQTGRSRLVTKFNLFWLWGGVILALSVGLNTIEFRSVDSFIYPLAITGYNLEPELLLILLVYFGLGFWLLSQAKLMEMNARWLINSIDKDKKVESQWQKITLLILLFVGFIASFLPTGPTLAISRILSAIVALLLNILNFLFYLIALIPALILSLFPNQPSEEFQPMPPTRIVPLTDNAAAANSELGETIMMVLSSAFWSIFIVVLVLALLFFIRERKSTFQGKSLSSIWQQFRFWLANLWRLISVQAKTVSIRIPVQLGVGKKKEDPQQVQRSWRFIRLGGLPPREQVRYFYLSTVRRAGKRGVERDAAETPSEFSKDLKAGWPEVEDELEELTGAFLRARYSNDPIGNEDIPDVKKTWKDVRREIRHQPKGAIEDSDSPPDEERPPAV